MKNINRREFLKNTAIAATSIATGVCIATAEARLNKDSVPEKKNIFFTDVPEHTYDIILGRPTDSLITVSILAYKNLDAFVTYGTIKSKHDKKTDVISLKQGEPLELLISSLQPDTLYYYSLNYKDSSLEDYIIGNENSFHTKRDNGKAFTFTVQADSHLDHNTNPDIYKQTLQNASSDNPDFHIALGDTFMVDKYGRNSYKDSLKQYIAQRYYFGQICKSVPLFFVLGNHDGEKGSKPGNRSNEISTWSANTRKKYLPNPFPNNFYSGNKDEIESIGLLEDYYAWEWSDCLFMVLDPYWYTSSARGKHNGWDKTLGKNQYFWMKNTLEASKAKFKFIFIHNLVGGSEQSGRGGVEVAKFYEWGGYNPDGTYVFQEKRPGWDKPIHLIFVENNVSIVFHGHDHFFAKQDLDGIVYQLVPQPGHKGYGRTGSAREYGYLQGDILPGTGYLRVSISKEKAIIDFIRTYLSKDENRSRKNGELAFSYSVAKKHSLF